MYEPDEAFPIEAPLCGDERDGLTGSLERQRRLFAWKTGDLDAAALQMTTSASSMTIGSLVKHLALVEDQWFTARLLGGDITQFWGPAIDEADPDWEWRSAAGDTPAELYTCWSDAVSRSRKAVRSVLDRYDMDQTAAWVRPDGNAPNLRRLMIDMIEEYARHLGHADILREAIDGLVGEEPS